MHRILRPDFYVDKYDRLSPDFFMENGIYGLLTELDDTLVAHNSMQVPQHLKSWIQSLVYQNIRVCILSNNVCARVAPFAHELGIPYICRAAKPLRYGVCRAGNVLGVPLSECAVMGDQLFTDIAAAKHAKVRSVLVDPVSTDAPRFVRWKRKQEALIRGQFEKNAGCGKNGFTH